MYLWKCWRDTRSVFLFGLIAIVATDTLGLFVHFDPLGWIAAKGEWPRTLWTTTTHSLMLTMVGITPIGGFLVGALGVGTEFEKGTAEFLLTRPRSRRLLLWTNWAVGALEMVTLVILSITMVWVGRLPSNSIRGARALVGMSIIALVIYSVTYLMTTLLRSSRHGLSSAVLAFMAYTGLGVWLQLWYEIAIPNVWHLVFSLPSPEVVDDLPVLGWFGWLAVCLACMLVAQVAFERQEV